MKKITLYLLLIVGMASLLSSCGGDKKYRIGVSQCSKDDWRDKLNEEIKREMLFHDDAEVEILTADDDNSKQIADIRYFIDHHFDIIIAAPNQSDSITPILSEAYNSGIPVLVFDRGVIGNDYSCYMEFDNEGIGEAAANYAINIIDGPAEIIEITGLPGSTPAEERHRGFTRVINNDLQKKIVASVTGIWKENVAEDVMDSLIRIYPDVDIVYAHNDIMAIGAAKALKNRGVSDVIILGTDAAPNLGIKAVKDSIIHATFMYPTDGQRLIRTAMKILKGQPYKHQDIIPAQSSAIDARLATILLNQDSLLQDQTKKIEFLNEKNYNMLNQHKVQRMFIYSITILCVLFFVAILLLLRLFKQKNKFELLLTSQNEQLEKERDRQKVLYKQLDEATKSKLVFYTNVSHDLRTPLTLISEPVEVLARADYLTGSDKVLMKIALKNVKILKRLIDQILDFRKYENDKLSLNLVEVNISKLFSDWLEAFRGVAVNHNIKLSLSNHLKSVSTMALDPDKIERVFFNLMSNAFKYTPDNGTIDLILEDDNNSFSFSIVDSGKGIAKEDISRIFNRFYQVDKISPQGFGIGLCLTKAFIELHEGNIVVDSSLGKGSTFKVSLPVRHVDDKPIDDLSHISEAEVLAELESVAGSEFMFDNGKPLILVIDDNADILSMIRELLSPVYNIITAENGLHGIKLATKYVPDLIITDIMMPGMDGFECCKQIKEEISTSHIPVLMLTACNLDEQRCESYDCGADGYLSKPFNTDVLMARCKSLIENRKRVKNIYLDNANTSDADMLSRSERKPISDLNDKMGVESDFYSSFLTIVRRELGNADLSIEEIAGRFGIGQAQFTRKIKALTNLSPVEIIRQHRLQKARTLLISTEKTVSEIAYEVGFTSPAYLSKCFKDAFGFSPSDLRNKLSGSVS